MHDQEASEHIKLESLLKPLIVFKRPVRWRLCGPPFTILHRDTVPDMIVVMYYTVHCRTITRERPAHRRETSVFPASQLPLLAMGTPRPFTLSSAAYGKPPKGRESIKTLDQPMYFMKYLIYSNE